MNLKVYYLFILYLHLILQMVSLQCIEMVLNMAILIVPVSLRFLNVSVFLYVCVEKVFDNRNQQTNKNSLK